MAWSLERSLGGIWTYMKWHWGRLQSCCRIKILKNLFSFLFYVFWLYAILARIQDNVPIWILIMLLRGLWWLEWECFSYSHILTTYFPVGSTDFRDMQERRPCWRKLVIGAGLWESHHSTSSLLSTFMRVVKDVSFQLPTATTMSPTWCHVILWQSKRVQSFLYLLSFLRHFRIH